MMKAHILFALALAAFSPNAFGQNLSPSEAKLAASARARYYNLASSGFQSMSCFVAFDLATVPLLPQAPDDPIRKLVQRTEFTLAIDEKGRPYVQQRYPTDATDVQRQTALRVTGVMTSLVSGLFLTWTSKGFQGPIPPLDSQIASVTTTDAGYKFSLNVPGAPIMVFLDKEFSVTEIVSADDKTHEHPTYKSSPEGLVFAGNDALDESSPNGRTRVRYELGTSVINGLQVPSSARLRVNDNIDAKFSLNNCVVKKGITIHVAPPA